ncbi:Protein of unknown function [Pyronema omphalodes CBS 100304]|uniref:Uncharacterized protein n=1 Tax=Pyronema omphalodes (strain CBS 100304) TaxID=1076935 RepID=U4KXR8_PYROM|nr:Protein of unknown function [Pyronema omphalodes CBS 100304]
MRRYAKAILATMPEDSREKEWENGVQGAASAAAQQAGVRDMRDVGYRGADDQEMSGLWETGDNRFPEENLAVQLRQYSDASITGNSQMFSYLARLYDNAQTPKRSEQIVRRGGEILAAVRLLAGQPIHYRTPATGTEARNPSLVSVWGWKPHREIALAERVEERRRLRAAEARAKSREQKTLSRRGLPPNWRSGSVEGSDNGSRRSRANGSIKSLKSITEAVSSSQGEETRARMHMSWIDREMSRSRRRKEKAKEKETASDDTAFPDLYGGDGYVTTESIRSGMPAQIRIHGHSYVRGLIPGIQHIQWRSGYDIATKPSSAACIGSGFAEDDAFYDAL